MRILIFLLKGEDPKGHNDEATPLLFLETYRVIARLPSFPLGNIDRLESVII